MAHFLIHPRIAQRVLQGETYEQVADEYGEPPSEIRWIVHQFCLHAHRALYKSLETTPHPWGGAPLDSLRAHAATFLEARRPDALIFQGQIDQVRLSPYILGPTEILDRWNQREDDNRPRHG